MTVRNALLGVVTALTALTLTACGTAATGPAEGGRIKAVSSTNVWGSVVAAVGGDAVDVTSIISDPSGDPHSYEARPADVAAVRDADLVIFNGGGYDDFFATLIGPGSESARKIETFPLSGKASGHDEPPAEAGHDHEVNEHVWYDLETVRKVADQVAADLSAIKPGNKASFESNAADFTRRIEELKTKVEGIGRGKRVLETEPVSHYLLDLAGTESATPAEFVEAVENESDIPAAALAQVLDLVGKKEVAAVVHNTQTGNAAITQLVGKAAEVGVPVVEVTETLPVAAAGYLDWMTKQVDALAAALRG
ncbi:zinc ABC transporter substrate-binding protein [Saccharothrix violaceirubra]|uniref:Zinc/manganese transport system substrate-binding protein n=1 Tax=Saccharothrix violaceirubra TaxID=413306 RepID=A0A7W7WZI1_9PSEU|nr:zinc ABC transporter substrate-binding protein [Saccharothrix violaceirubra]MBB4968853.1 zinc/manganese transport system substrate-binding protein [Saccharothrix violaceirubra]